MNQALNQMEDTLEDLPVAKKAIAFVLLSIVGILVYTLAGYNYFMDSGTRLIVRVIVPIVLACALFILKKTGRDAWFSIILTYFSVSVGFLAAHILGTWYRLIPGLSLNTIQGISIAKFAEVLPILVAVIVLGLFVRSNLHEMKLRGGNISLSMKLGVYALPLSYVAFLLSGGAIVTVTDTAFLIAIPWLLLFALSNALMEELIFRGIFLDKLKQLFGERFALIQTSVIFGLFHVGILQTTGTEIIIVFTIFIMILGLAWGYIVQKSDSIWGAVFTHAIADILAVSVVLGLL
ncbi:MAG: CPBP family intramembrane glutamic endopeptidase [Candidatus Thorarchaeota archaeon]